MMMEFRFYHGRDWVSRVIEWFTQGAFSHVSVVFTADETATGVGALEYQAAPGGVTVSHAGAMDDAARVQTLTIFEPKLVNAAHEFCKAQVGLPYDYLGVVSFVFRRVRQSRRAWYCSELANEAMLIALGYAGQYSGQKGTLVSPDRLSERLEWFRRGRARGAMGR